jgi:hypothetical protein
MMNAMIELIEVTRETRVVQSLIDDEVPSSLEFKNLQYLNHIGC